MASQPHHIHHHHQRSPPGLVLGDRIGKGSFATVYKGQIAADGTIVAIKIVQRAHLKRDKRLLDNFEAEMAILKRMKHPHVVSLIEVIQTTVDFNLVMEYCSVGDLSRFIRKRGSLAKVMPVAADMFAQYPCPADLGLHEVVVRHFLSQLASALAFLRAHDLIHRDIKPQNLLLKPSTGSESEARQLGYVGLWNLPVLKIADFGFARFLPAASMAETLCGSPLYMAPEILHYEKYNAKADLWSVGAVAYEMAVGKPPFPAANHMELIKKIDETKDQINFPTGLPSDIVDIVSRLLLRSPTERLSFSAFFSHPAVTVYAQESDFEVNSITEKNSDLDCQSPNLQSFHTDPSSNQASPAPGSDPNISEQGSASASPSGTPSGTTPRQSATPPARTPGRNRFGRTSSASSTASGLLGFPGIPEEAIESSPSPTPSPAASGISGGNIKTSYTSDGGSSGLERDYVVIEKRTVEVNALADSLARADMRPGGFDLNRSGIDRTPPNSSRASGASGGSGAPGAPSAPSTPGISGHSGHGPESGGTTSARRRLSSIVYGASPTTALAQALLKSSARLFGSSKPGAGPAQGLRRSGLGGERSSELRDVYDELEQLATIGKVVSLYADVKYAQLPHSSGNSTDSRREHLVADGNESTECIARATLSLYLKALSVFAQAMDRASQWWDPSHPETLSGVGQLVQWIRDKFNECIERAEVVRSMCDGNSASASELSAEKLLFDRAVEMSRAAAVQEQAAGIEDNASEALATSEMNYGTAVWMLRALLVPSNDDSNDDSHQLSSDDRAMVHQMMAKIAERVAGLKKRRMSVHERNSPTPLTPP